MKLIHSKIFYFLFLFLFINSTKPSFGQNDLPTDSLLAEAISFFDTAQEQEALNTYLKVLDADPDNFEALWHTSLLYSRLGFRLSSKKEMMDYYQKALKYANRSLKHYPEEGYSHFVYAVANGRISDISKSQTRIKKSHIVKKHAQKAVELLPDYAPAWHLLGLWHSKVANVNSTKQFAAGLFSKGIPKGASNQKAVEYIQKAMQLQPEQIIRYKLDLGRHYHRAGETEKAKENFKEVLQLEPANEVDQWNQDRARELLNEIQ